MTESPLPAPAVPAWTLGDRMRKAREHAGLKQSELAGEIGVGRSTIVTYETGRSQPSRPVLLSWALRCGVPYEWLAEDGHGGGLPNRFPSHRGGSRSREREVISTNRSTRHLRLVA
jgi:transcriptional regulator with XRE-family HTH domain